MATRKLSQVDQARRELVIETAAIVYTRRLMADPRRLLVARRRQVARMGWFR